MTSRIIVGVGVELGVEFGVESGLGVGVGIEVGVEVGEHNEYKEINIWTAWSRGIIGTKTLA